MTESDATSGIPTQAQPSPRRATFGATARVNRMKLLRAKELYKQKRKAQCEVDGIPYDSDEDEYDEEIERAMEMIQSTLMEHSETSPQSYSVWQGFIRNSLMPASSKWKVRQANKQLSQKDTKIGSPSKSKAQRAVSLPNPDSGSAFAVSGERLRSATGREVSPQLRIKDLEKSRERDLQSPVSSPLTDEDTRVDEDETTRDSALQSGASGSSAIRSRTEGEMGGEKYVISDSGAATMVAKEDHSVKFGDAPPGSLHEMDDHGFDSEEVSSQPEESKKEDDGEDEEVAAIHETAMSKGSKKCPILLKRKMTSY